MTGVVAGSAIFTFETTRSAAGAANGSYSASDAARKLYFGTVGGKVFRLSDPDYGSASATPVEITPGAGFVSDISVNPEDEKEIMVTYSNYSVSSVRHTTDASAASPAWTEVEGPGASAVSLASVRSALVVRVGTQTIYPGWHLYRPLRDGCPERRNYDLGKSRKRYGHSRPERHRLCHGQFHTFASQ